MAACAKRAPAKRPSPKRAPPAMPPKIRRAHAVQPVSALQTEYSLFERGVENALLPAVRELCIGFVPYSPLGRGFLTGAAKRAEELPVNDWRAKNDPRLQGCNFDDNAKLADFVRQVGREK